MCGPLLGVTSAFSGSAQLMKLQSSFNSTAVLVNYPLTLAVMMTFGEDPFYVALVVILILNKVVISFTGAKVRQHWINPGFSKNFATIKERFTSLLMSKGASAESAQERASSLTSVGLPSLTAGRNMIRALDSDEEDEDEDETSYGIIPKGRLGSQGYNLSQF